MIETNLIIETIQTILYILIKRIIRGIGKFSDEASYLPIIELVGVRSKCTPYIEKIMKE